MKEPLLTFRSFQLAMVVLGSIFAGAYVATRGGGQKAQTTPPIQASSKDEENFIQSVSIPCAFPRSMANNSYREFLKEAESKEAKH